MSGRPKQRPEPMPGDARAETRELHEAIQEARSVIREMKATEARLTQIITEVRKASSDIVSELKEYMKITTAAQIDRFAQDLTKSVINTGDLIAKARDEVAQQFESIKEYQAKMLGAESAEQLVKLIADMILGDVLDGMRDLKKEQDERIGQAAETIIIDMRKGKQPTITRKRGGNAK